MATNRAGFPRRPLRLDVADAHWLSTLGSVPIDGNSLKSQPPSFDVRLLDFFDSDIGRQVNRFGYGTGNERLDGAHHPKVSEVVDGSGSVCRLEGAIENRQVLGFKSRSSFDRAPLVDVLHNSLHLGIVVAKLSQS